MNIFLILSAVVGWVFLVLAVLYWLAVITSGKAEEDMRSRADVPSNH
jgi:hypothetical protein